MKSLRISSMRLWMGVAPDSQIFVIGLLSVIKTIRCPVHRWPHVMVAARMANNSLKLMSMPSQDLGHCACIQELPRTAPKPTNLAASVKSLMSVENILRDCGMKEDWFHEWSSSHHQWMSSFASFVSVMWWLRLLTVYMRSISLRVKIRPGLITFEKNGVFPQGTVVEPECMYAYRTT